MMGKKGVIVAGVLATLLLSFTSLFFAEEHQAALTEKETTELIKQHKNNLKDVGPMLEQRGVDFDIDPKIEKKLRKAGADDETVQEVWKATPKGRASEKAILSTATGAQVQITPKEGMAFQTIQNELDPERQIVMVDQFEKEFPGSPILSHVYAQGARAYQEKNNLGKAVEYGEKSLKLDPDNLPALLVVAVSVSQPSMLRGSEAEKNARLVEAQRDSGRVLKLLDAMPMQPGETGEQLQLRKRGMAADAHFVLGMVDLFHDEPAKAVEEFKDAITSSAKPTPQYYYRLGDAYSSTGKTDDAIASFKQASELGKGTAIEQMADKRIVDLMKRKP